MRTSLHTIVDPELQDEEREAVATSLFRQIQRAGGELGEVRRVPTVAEPGSKSLGGSVIGALVALLSAANLRPFLDFLVERLRSHAFELELEVDGRKFKLKSSAPEQLQVALRAAEQFIGEVPRAR